MNTGMKNVTVIDPYGRRSEMERVFIRGGQVLLVIFPDMLKMAPMFERLRKAAAGKSTAGGLGRGRLQAIQERGSLLPRLHCLWRAFWRRTPFCFTKFKLYFSHRCFVFAARSAGPPSCASCVLRFFFLFPAERKRQMEEARGVGRGRGGPDAPGVLGGAGGPPGGMMPPPGFPGGPGAGGFPGGPGSAPGAGAVPGYMGMAQPQGGMGGPPPMGMGHYPPPMGRGYGGPAPAPGAPGGYGFAGRGRGQDMARPAWQMAGSAPGASFGGGGGRL